MRFAERVKSVMNRGNMRIADIARIMHRSHSTVYGWVTKDFNPQGAPQDVEVVYKWLDKLEQDLSTQSSKLLPVPRGMSNYQRTKHIEILRKKLWAREKAFSDQED